MPKKQLSEAERLQHALHACRLLVWAASAPKDVREAYVRIAQRDALDLAREAMTAEERAIAQKQRPEIKELRAAVKVAAANEERQVSAFACAYALEEAFAKAGDDGADSVDWEDVGLAREHGQEALGDEKVRQIQEEYDALNNNDSPSL